VFVLRTAFTWDGQPAEPGEVAEVRLDGRRLSIRAPFHGDPAPDGPPGSLWKLWEHEVVELFLLGQGDHYLELELGPHGHYLVLRLEGRRNVVEHSLPWQVRFDRAAGQWSAEAEIPHAWLPRGPLRANAFAIHGERYLVATPLPGRAPDFHRIELFRPLSAFSERPQASR